MRLSLARPSPAAPPGSRPAFWASSAVYSMGKVVVGWVDGGRGRGNPGAEHPAFHVLRHAHACAYAHANVHVILARSAQPSLASSRTHLQWVGPPLPKDCVPLLGRYVPSPVAAWCATTCKH